MKTKATKAHKMKVSKEEEQRKNQLRPKPSKTNQNHLDKHINDNNCTKHETKVEKLEM